MLCHFGYEGAGNNPAGEKSWQSDGIGLSHAQPACIDSQRGLMPTILRQRTPQGRFQTTSHAMVKLA